MRVPAPSFYWAVHVVSWSWVDQDAGTWIADVEGARTGLIRGIAGDRLRRMTGAEWKAIKEGQIVFLGDWEVSLPIGWKTSRHKRAIYFDEVAHHQDRLRADLTGY